MPYWLLCPSCKQWNKSTTPLSADKFCSFCSKALVRVKPSINAVLDQETAVKAQEIHQDNNLPETGIIPDTPPITGTPEPQLETYTIREAAEQIEKQEVYEATDETETEEILAVQEKTADTEEEPADTPALSPEEEDPLEMIETSSPSGLRDEISQDEEGPVFPPMTKTHESFIERKRRVKKLR